PAGSYAPEFRCQVEAPASLPPVPRARAWVWFGGGALALAGVAAAAAIWLRSTPAIEGFWGPVFHSGRPVLLCVAHPAVHRLGAEARAAFEAGTPPESVPATEIARDAEHYVGFGDALALAHLDAFFTRGGKPVQLRLGSDVSFADLRGSPAVLIGAFTNQWTMEITNDLRFA